jgi:hypothetical protein
MEFLVTFPSAAVPPEIFHLHLAVAGLELTQEMWLIVGVALTLLGTLLQWQLPRRRMSAEERMKDGDLTEAEAARMIRFHAVLAPALTIAGAALMLWVIVGFLG